MDMQKLVDNLNEQEKIKSGQHYNIGYFKHQLESIKEESEYSHIRIKLPNGKFVFPKVEVVGMRFSPEGEKEMLPSDIEVHSVFDSWRGNYCEHLMYFSRKNYKITPKMMIGFIHICENKYFKGYKGDDFIFDKRSAINFVEQKRNIGYLVGTEEKRWIYIKATGIKITPKFITILTTEWDPYSE